MSFHYAHYSPACELGGSGDCDGFDYGNHGKECNCSCHDGRVVFNTMDEAQDWHAAE